jgi:hypothetical protein
MARKGHFFIQNLTFQYFYIMFEANLKNFIRCNQMTYSAY